MPTQPATEWLQREWLGNTVEAWLIAALAVIGVAAFVVLLREVVRRYLQRLATRTTTGIDDVAADLVGRTRLFFAVAVGLYVATLLLRLPDAAIDGIRKVTVTLMLVQAGLWGSGLVREAIDRFTKRSQDPATASATGILRVLGFVGVWAIALLLVLANLGFDVTAGIAGLGIGGVAVALATQNILGDLFASLSIVLDRPFAVGDFIVVADKMGTVEHIGIKTTRVRSLTGEQLIFGNADLLSARVHNMKRMTERRVLLRIGVTYETPPDRLEEIPALLRSLVEGHPKVRFDRSHLIALGPSSIDFELVYFVLDAEFLVHADIQQAVLLRVLREFERRGVEIAYPTQTVHVRSAAPAAPPTDAPAPPQA